ncbi:cobalamin B12-binding domain-containing protein [Nocardioides hankookensis]
MTSPRTDIGRSVTLHTLRVDFLPSTPRRGAAHAWASLAGMTSSPGAAVRRIRIVVGKPGLDGHDRGAKIVARALRDAGHEVVYTGLHQTPEQIVETAIQEDADLIGLSVLSGAHMTLFRRLLELLAERDASDIVVFGGGIIPEEDIPVLEDLGVAKVFTPGATTGEISGWVAEHFAEASG